MLHTQHISGIIMPIIRSTVKDDKPHMVFCTGRAVVDFRRWGGSRVHLMAVVCSRTTTAIKCTWDPPHLLKSTIARPVQNTVCGLSSLLVLLMMGMMLPETYWVTNINKLQLNCIQLVLSSHLHDSKKHCHIKLKLFSDYLKRVTESSRGQITARHRLEIYREGLR
jgi:hypothetical protein